MGTIQLLPCDDTWMEIGKFGVLPMFLGILKHFKFVLVYYPSPPFPGTPDRTVCECSAFGRELKTMWDLPFLQEEDSWPDEDRTEVEKFATVKLTVMRTRHSSCDKNKQSKTHYLLSHAVWETCDSIGDNSSTVVPSYGTLKTGLSLQ